MLEVGTVYAIETVDGFKFRGAYEGECSPGVLRFQGRSACNFSADEIKTAKPAKAQAVKAERAPRTCSRCGGSGKYRNYGECFGCGGRGKV